MQFACSLPCAKNYAVKEREKEERKELREAREKIKTITDHLKDAQAAFNAYIRFRDKNKPCISCGRHHKGQMHAGHYRTVGACSSLRFDESNVHSQCAPCNNHKSGNITEYRINLIQKIGAKEVERLETAPKSRRWTVDEAKEIRLLYKEKLKQLKKDEHV